MRRKFKGAQGGTLTDDDDDDDDDDDGEMISVMNPRAKLESRVSRMVYEDIS